MDTQCPEALQTPVLLEQAQRVRAVLAEHGVQNDSATTSLLDTWLLPILAVSPYVAKTLGQFPDLLPELIKRGSLVTMPQREGVQAAVQQTRQAARSAGAELVGQLAVPASILADVSTLNDELNDNWGRALEALSSLNTKTIEAAQQRVLRIFRHRHMVRILWCDLSGVSTLEQTLYELSLLAQSCVMVADQWSFKALASRFGAPCDGVGWRQRLIILGMGKLGGFELNVSSDIDLICIYPYSGSTATSESGQKSLDNGEFFTRSVQRINKLLNSVTAEGFVYRVDMRLRPFGESGPVVMNLEGLENYYLTQARDWERYAMIKARPLCGDPHDIHALEQLLTPFIYRRYLDYNAFQAMRELKRKIALSLLKKAMVDNIKLGAGGIREIEFIGQAFQLVRGGRDSRLRIRPIVRVLSLLEHLELLPRADVHALVNAYRYLRTVENALQMMRDEQIHALPTSEEDQLRLLCMMHETQWSSFRETLAMHQDNVSRCFADLFEPAYPADTEAQTAESAQLVEMQDLWAALSAPAVSDKQKTELLQAAGYSVDDSTLSIITTLACGSGYQKLTSESQHRVDLIVPLILRLASDTPQPHDTLTRMLTLVKAVAGRSGYLQVLVDQPDALQRLVSLFSQSRWLAAFVARQPMVIDELLTQANLPVDSASAFEETHRLVERLTGCELDEQMDTLRHYRQGRELRIAQAQLDGSLSLMQVSDQLSWLAESVIAGVLKLVSASLAVRFGRPMYSVNSCVDEEIENKEIVKSESQRSHVAVIAYGKLGGLELGFSSDLDLVFVHDSVGPSQMTDGPKPIDNSQYYAKLAQKFVHFMGTRTPAGVLYEIDLRLRPNGTAGVLITGIESFAAYQLSDAWTWEHQALMRARLVYGSADLEKRFDDVRQQVLASERPADELRAAVANMRERMRQAFGSTEAGKMHLKQDAGGIADIEFIVQYLVLAHSKKHPQLLAYTDNVRVLDTVSALALLPEEQCRVLREAYLVLREQLHRQALDEQPAIVEKTEKLEKLCAAVIELRKRVLHT